MTCPVCDGTADPAAQVGTIAVCANCGASIAGEPDGTVRRATAVETSELSDADLDTLRAARGRIARPNRRQR